jgi:hypothetical protein
VGQSKNLVSSLLLLNPWKNTVHGQAAHKRLSDTHSTYLTGDLLDGNFWWFYALAVAGKQKF